MDLEFGCARETLIEIHRRRPSDHRVTFRTYECEITGKSADKYGHTSGEHIAK
jgi:hypothetical protein